MTGKEKKAVLARINKCKERIAAEREKLREIIDELEDIDSVASEAVDDLESAIDRLSRYL